MESKSENADRLLETWAVHRQDDNGNRFVMETGLSREKADELVRTYEARGHKQMYWVEREMH